MSLENSLSMNSTNTHVSIGCMINSSAVGILSCPLSLSENGASLNRNP